MMPPPTSPHNLCWILEALDDLVALMPGLSEFPLVPMHIEDKEDLYHVLEWQKVGAKAMIRHYLNVETILTVSCNHNNSCHSIGLMYLNVVQSTV